MSQSHNPPQRHSLMPSNYNGQSNNTVGMLVPPIYNPYVQTSNEFEQQMGLLMEAPEYPFFETPEIDQSLEGLFDSLSAQNILVTGSKVCTKGHQHPRWPIKGDLDIKKCERRCDYCKKELGTAAALRKARRQRPRRRRRGRLGGLPSAPKKTRTSTDQSVHKALNPNRPA